MPLPLLFIGIGAVAGALGVGKSAKAVVDVNSANKLNNSATALIEDARDLLERQRLACGRSLEKLGEEKLFILNSSIMQFLDGFTRIKNVEFANTEGLDELSRLHIDSKEFEELQELSSFAGAVAGGAASGVAGGAITAFGAYGAAQTFAVASTGTAIASLHGAAAANATLAFFGGGSLAVNGLGIAGGMVVLGGLVAGPALMTMGFVAGAAAKKNLEKAKINRAEALETAAQSEAASLQCEAIRRRTYVFYNLLARLDSYLLPLIYRMEDILKDEGDDYRQYKYESKKAIASCVSVAVAVKAVLDTPLLTEEGLLTSESEQTARKTEDFANGLEAQ